MKKLNALLFGSFLILVAALPFQPVSSGELPLKSSNDPRTTFPKLMARVSSSVSTITINPVTANLNDTELVLNFNSPIGTALVTIEDQMGGIVYVYSINTTIDSELIIPMDGWDSGNYKLTISYGTKTLIGSFDL